MTAKPNAPIIAVDREELRIAVYPGESEETVVSFTGIGHAMGGVQTAEFHRTLAPTDGSPTCTMISVIDTRRRWYNDGLATTVTDAVNDLLQRSESRRTVALGNSMGGFGAIVFARRLLRCDLSIAFSPQSSVHPDIVPFEARWMQWRAGIETWDLPDAVAELDPSIRYEIFYGTEHPADLLHAARFQDPPRANVRITMIPGCAHTVPAHLKAQGQLRSTLDRLIRG